MALHYKVQIQKIKGSRSLTYIINIYDLVT